MCISLRPYNFFMRSNVNLGSFGVTGVKRTFSAKMLLLLQNTWCYLYVTQCIYVAHKYALTWDSLLHSMGQGQITSSGRVRHLWWQMCLVLHFFSSWLGWYVAVFVCVRQKLPYHLLRWQMSQNHQIHRHRIWAVVKYKRTWLRGCRTRPHHHRTNSSWLRWLPQMSWNQLVNIDEPYVIWYDHIFLSDLRVQSNDIVDLH